MSNTEIKFNRVNSVPTTWMADSVYFVAVGANKFETYITNSAGVPRHQPANDAVEIVDDITARNALNPTQAIYVYVIDATGDSTVAAGGATYLWRPSNSTWIKTSEAESLDLQLSWAAITGKPNSTPSQIDNAVSQSHTHSNKAVLDKVGENENGKLIFNGDLPSTGWTATEW